VFFVIKILDTFNMKISLRQFIAWLIFIFIALPSLFGSIWAVGAAKGALSKQVISDAPRQLIPQIPDLIDLTFTEAQKPGVLDDSNTILWVDAAAKQDISPRELLEQIGLFDWLNRDLDTTLQQLGEILDGKVPASELNLDLRALKEILLSPQIMNYLFSVTRELPQCTSNQLAVWQSLTDKQPDENVEVPACNPGQNILNLVYENYQTNVNKIPDKADPVSQTGQNNQAININRIVGNLAFSIFIFPLVFLLIGALLVSTKLNSRLRSSGTIILIAGLNVLLLATLARNSTNFALMANTAWSPATQTKLSLQFQQSVSEKIIPILGPAINQIFKPVIDLSLWVSMAGLLLVIISFTISQNNDNAKALADKRKSVEPPVGDTAYLK